MIDHPRFLHVALRGTLAGLLFSGCMGYRVGPVLKADYRSVAVPMFKNKTLKPQLEAQVTNGIIRRLQSDGTLRVDSLENADIVLDGEIVSYRRTRLRALQTEASTPREFRVYIDARVEAHNRVTGKIILPPTIVTGSADTFIGDDLQSAEFQALPLIADDLARQVVSLLVESW
jgi:Lipopolysaccharide-assembly